MARSEGHEGLDRKAGARRLALGLVLATAGWVFGLACTPAEPPPSGPLRLVDHFATATVSGGVAPEAPAPIAWSFADPAPEATEDDGGEGFRGFRAVRGIEGLRVEGGTLVGTASDDMPLLVVEVAEAPSDDDVLHSVEIRMRASEAGNLRLRGDREMPEGPKERLAGIFPWPLQSPVVAGDEPQLYTLTAQETWRLGQSRFVLVQPTDAAGSEFAIESLRLITRRGHLLSVPTGIGWHGMGEIYHESLVSRAGETLRFDLRLPESPWLDLATATLGESEVEMVATVEVAGERTVVLEATPEEGNRWSSASGDLATWGGQQVTLELAVSSDQGDALGFWGSPTVRSRVAASAATDETGPQGVVMILTDTLRRDHLPFYGYERDTAPVLGRMAAEGMLAEDALSQSTWTKLSVTSIFTSLYPTTHTVRSFPDRLPASAQTLAEHFYAAGHATLGLSSIPFTGKATNMHQGYEEFHESSSLPRDLNAKTARHHVDRLLPWLEEHRDGRFFVFLHVADPHSPYEPYAPFDTAFGEEGDVEEYVRQRDATGPFTDNPLMRRFGMPKTEDIVEAGLDPETYVALQRDAYDGSILGMDEQIGRVITQLEALGLRDKVLVGVVSDHGTEFLDHDDHFHGHTVYGELNQVPMLLWGPGFVPPTRIEPTVETLDLMPTVLELAGIEVRDQLQGQSLVPLLGDGSRAGEGQRFRPRPAITEVWGHPPRMLPQDTGDQYALADGEWKLVRYEPVGGEPRSELYHRVEDPLDQVDRAADYPDVVAQLEEQLAAWKIRASEQRLSSDAELAEGMSAEELDRLRSLGYVQ